MISTNTNYISVQTEHIFSLIINMQTLQDDNIVAHGTLQMT